MIANENALNLFAICYQIAGTICLADGEVTDKDEELLLNTLARPNGPGARLLLSNKGPYQDVMDAALAAEKMIDLEPFTGKNHRTEWVNKPFNVGEETIATDGSIIIAVKKRAEFGTEEDLAWRVSRCFGTFPTDFTVMPKVTQHLKNESTGWTVLRVGETALHIDKKYYDLIKDLPGLKVAILADGTGLHWKSDESRGMLMGVRV